MSSYSFKDNLTIDNNKYLKWINSTGTSRSNIICLDNSNNINFNSASGDFYINSNNSGSNTFINKSNLNSVIIGSKVGIGISSTDNINGSLTIAKDGFISINSSDGSLGLSGGLSLDNSSGSRIILYGNSTGGQLNLYGGNSTGGSINLFTGNDSLKISINTNGNVLFTPDGNTIVLDITESQTTLSNPLILTSTVESHSASSGALQIYGGIGIKGNLYLDGTFSMNTVTTSGNINFDSSQDSLSYTTGAIFITGGLGIATTRNASSVTAGGALSIAGGAAIAKDTYIGGKITILDSTVGISAQTGSMVVYGSMGINEAIYSRSNSASQIKLAPVNNGNETSISFFTLNNFDISATGGNSTWKIGQLGSGDFGISNVEYGRIFNILNNGNIGIGTTNPTKSLEVSGDILVSNLTTGNINFTGNLYKNNALYISSQWSDSGSNVYFSGGNVGVGTSNPSKSLEVSGDVLLSNLTTGNINFTGNLYQNSSLYISSQWSDSGSNVYFSGGNVGVGTSNPSKSLEVSGDVLVNDITTGNINFTGNLYQNSALYISSQWSDSGSNVYYSGGNVGINTTNPTSKLTVNGDVTIIGDLNCSSGNLYLNTLSTGISNFFSGTFIASNNVVSPTNITGLYFDSSIIRSFNIDMTVSVLRTTGGNYYESISLQGVKSDLNWVLYTSTIGDSSGIVVSLSSGGNLQYTSPNFTNWTSSTLRYTVSQISSDGIIGTVPITTVLSIDTIHVNNTTDSSGIGTGGSVTILGGVSVSKTLYSSKLITSDLTTGNLNFTGNLYQNGSLFSGSSQWSNSGNNVYYSGGNVGINTTDPTKSLEVVGDALVSNLTTGNLNFTGNLYQNGGLFSGSTQWSNSGSNVYFTGGNVGIGTSTPGSALTVIGDASISGNLNCTFGNLYLNSLCTGISTIFSGTFIASNNVVTSTDITGLSFDSSIIRNFYVDMTISVLRTTGGNLYQSISLQAIRSSLQWELFSSGIGDSTGLVITISTSGNLQYTSPNFTNWSSTTIRYSVNQMSANGSLPPLPLINTDLSIDTLQLNNTSNAVLGSNNGALYVLGGMTVEQSVVLKSTTDSLGIGSGGSVTILGGVAVSGTLYSSKVLTSDLTTGNLNFTGDLYQNGSLFSGSSQWSDSASNVYFTGGNVGINTTNPSKTLHVVGDTLVSNLTTGNINFTGNLYQNGSLFSGSSQWSDSGSNVYFTGGNVGINTTNPSANLDINGTLNMSDTGVNIVKIYAGTFTTGNNVNTSTDTNIQFTNSQRGFNINLAASVLRTSGGNLYELFTLEGIQTDLGWNVLYSSIGDISGVGFSITTSGNVQYTTTNITNWISTTLKYNVTQILV
jgi:hypothetical protein